MTQPPSEAPRGGTVFWFTGLSGAGKSTLGELFAERLRRDGRVVVFLDGDILRDVFGASNGHTLEDRRKVAERNARLCRMLSSQGVDVVIATISLFGEVHRWNRDHIPEYREVFLEVPWEELRRRDRNALYSRFERGELRDVVGMDLPYDRPQDPHLVLVNDGSRPPQDLVTEAYQALIQGSIP